MMFRWPSCEGWKRLHPSLRGRERLTLVGVRTAASPGDNSLIFVSNMTDEILGTLMSCSGCLLLLSDAQREMCEPLEEHHGVIYTDNPRYQYAEILDGFFDPVAWRGPLKLDAEREFFVGEDVAIDASAVVEPGVTIARDCVVGQGAHVMSGARLGPRVKVGAGNIIRENTVVGGYGFGLAMAEGKPNIRIPHIGGVMIGNNVEVGALTTVCSGTIDATMLADRVKTDDHVHIAHNCHIGEDVVITACAEMSGSVSIGPRTWLGPNCSVVEKVRIGCDCFIGIGAVVTSDVADGTRVAGNPARRLRGPKP